METAASRKAKAKKRLWKERPPRTANRFRRSETTRIMRAAIAAGLRVERVEFDSISGRVQVIIGEGLLTPRRDGEAEKARSPPKPT